MCQIAEPVKPFTCCDAERRGRPRGVLHLLGRALPHALRIAVAPDVRRQDRAGGARRSGRTPPARRGARRARSSSDGCARASPGSAGRSPSSASARSTSKWSPQQASSRPSKPQRPAFSASSSSGRSAHWPVKRVTGLAIGAILRCIGSRRDRCRPPARPGRRIGALPVAVGEHQLHRRPCVPGHAGLRRVPRPQAVVAASGKEAGELRSRLRPGDATARPPPRHRRLVPRRHRPALRPNVRPVLDARLRPIGRHGPDPLRVHPGRRHMPVQDRAARRLPDRPRALHVCTADEPRDHLDRRHQPEGHSGGTRIGEGRPRRGRQPYAGARRGVRPRVGDPPRPRQATRRCSRTPTSTPSTSHCRTRCTSTGRSGRSRPASTCSARSR